MNIAVETVDAQLFLSFPEKQNLPDSTSQLN